MISANWILFSGGFKGDSEYNTVWFSGSIFKYLLFYYNSKSIINLPIKTIK